MKYESEPEEAYLDRNLCVQTMVRMASELGYNTGIRDDGNWSIFYIDLPTGQVSWHIPKLDIVGMFPEYLDKWDGHDVETKRNRLREFIESKEEDQNNTKFKMNLKNITIGKEDRDREFMSLTEVFILTRLYVESDGSESSSEIKREAYFLNGNDVDEIEEAIENLRSLGYIQYEDRRFTITEAGKEQLQKVAKFEDRVE